MGCYNQSCFFSRLDINHYDQCYLLPILKNPRVDSINDGEFMLYKPFCLPILGQYDDYGSIEKIKKDANTKSLERFFEGSIEDVVACLVGRKDKYGDYSGIQKLYGNPKVVVTKESLESIHFTTKDGVLSHPWLDHYIALNNKDGKWPLNYDKTPWKGFTMKWLENGDLEVLGYLADGKPKIFKNGQEAGNYSGFLMTAEYLLDRLRKEHWFKDLMIFGIPSKFQKKAALLLKLKATFLRKEVWDIIPDKMVEYIVKDRTWMESGWLNKAYDELLELEKNYRAAVEFKNSVTERPVPKEIEKKWDEAYWLIQSNDRLRNVFVEPFANDTAQDFKIFDVYSDFSDAEIKDGLMKFYGLSGAMALANIPLIESHSFQQHGNIGEQLMIQNEIIKIARKVNKKRDY